MQEATKIIHSIPTDELTGALSTPIYQTSTFVQESPGVNKGFDYARSNNPTRKVLEDLIATMENGYGGYAFASGLAAIDAVLKLLKSGDEILAVDDIYGGAFRLFTHIYEKFGIKITYVDTTEVENVTEYISNKTKLVWLETPTNPTLKISDIEAISKIAHEFGALVVVDNTFASPALQKPLDIGADIIVHSATKYLAGHSDVIAGLVVTKSEELGEQIKFIQNASGGILAPHDSWLTIRGIQTLALRIEKQCENAFAVTRFLASCEIVDKVHYPGLVNHKNHDVAKKQQTGFGGIVSFSLKDDNAYSAIKFTKATKLFQLAESLGGAKSLLCHPATMTHKSTPGDIRRKAGVQDSLIRLSCGLEEAEDLVNDIEQALNYIRKNKFAVTFAE